MSNHLSQILVACVIAATAWAAYPAGPRREGRWRIAAVMAAPELSEASGLAASRRQPGLWWTHNDSGHAAELFGFDADGRLLARVRVQEIAEDWEDLASFEWRGEPYLAIADTGDNLAWRRQSRVLLVAEPVPGQQTVAPTRTLHFSYPDGPRDVEALAVDAVSGLILLLEKRRPPARLYALDLAGPDEQVARVVGELPAVPPAAAVPAQTLGAGYSRDMVTAMDLAPDRRELVLMTYRRVLRYRVGADRTWSEVLRAGPAAWLELPRDARLYEAVAIDGDGRVWATSEGVDPPLLQSLE